MNYLRASEMNIWQCSDSWYSMKIGRSKMKAKKKSSVNKAVEYVEKDEISGTARSLGKSSQPSSETRGRKGE